MTSALLIANPSASQFTGGLHRRTMQVLARRFDTTPVWPQSPDHSREVARDAAERGVDLVVAMGGDGIVHHVAQGLVGTDSVLGIIPSGTTNVLARLLGVPQKAAAAAKMLGDGHDVVSSPTVEVAASGPSGEWTAHALFSLGIGPDATVVAAAETEPYRKYRFGGLHYANTAVRVIWNDVRKRRPSLTVTTSEAHEGIGAMVQFLPRYTYFGRVPLRLDDETPDPMSVLTIQRLPLRRIPWVLGRAVGGSIGDVHGFHLDRGVEHFTVEAEDPAEVQMDGEHYGLVSTMSATARPASLQIAVPQASPR